MKVLKHMSFAAWALASPVVADDLVVFAAASLKGPLDVIAADVGDVRISYGGSGTLARQVQHGAPADVILLANEDWMRVLQEDAAVKTPVAIAGNRLVVIGPEGAGPLDLMEPAFKDALGDGRLAMGFVAAVPAGIYGQAALAHLGLWEALRPSVAEVDSVRGAVALVARGEAPLGIVYESDARLVPGVSVRATFPAEAHPPIVYWGAVVTGADHPGAEAFLQTLTEESGQDALREAGFCPIAQGCPE